MRHLSFALGIFALLHQSFALAGLPPQRVWISPPGIKAVEFNSMVLLQGGETFTSYFRKNNPSPRDSETLGRAFEAAQASFLSDSKEKAKLAFENVLRLSRIADWGPDERKALFESYLRRAQLEDDETQRRKWVVEAVRFSPYQSPNAELFPPPIQELFKESHKNEIAGSLKWDVSELQDQVSLILINGSVFDPNKVRTITLLPGQHRVTLLSNSHAPESRILEQREVLEIQRLRRPFLESACGGNPMNLPRDINIMDIEVYSGSDCEPRNFAKETFTQSKSNSMDLSPKLQDQESRNWWPWIIGGAITAAVGVFVIQSQKKQPSETVPTHD